MQDILFVAIIVAFFALAVGFVKACEHIIGPDMESAAAEETGTDDVAAEHAA